jgi:hypothetical protein
MDDLVKLKVDIVDTLNQVIVYMNGLDNVPAQFELFDLKSKIIIDHLEAICKRAIEINDERLLDYLHHLGCVSEILDS